MNVPKKEDNSLKQTEIIQNKGERTTFISHIHPRFVSEAALKFVSTFCLGGLSALSFLVLAITGVLLMFHYQPGENSAFSSLLNLSSVIPYGAILRNWHYWSGQIMVISVSMHMIRVVWTHSYKPPKQLNWLVGIGLLLLTLFMDFTGYLLRGSQESGAAANVAVHLSQLIPMMGQPIAQIFFGKPSPLSGSTLMVYVWHCVGLPVIALGLQLYHFWRVRRDGGVRPL
ncbi:cytochrome b N-terminal domain-containing protein [Desulfitobacterium sp.]|uniref:cytochrome b N-terminal domain-containing protein n=1 Tax=Desulfitobacterium sp. TaxID=49981 RepID=UPI002B20FF00|nr:cytochrome b N-terminal domain-containing protein [Desulfitobacterium sp.]MEA4900898.1 cytochrome b N-terminal domain-containing protein [Desulfitobacterium sp.]